jgi:hypothetical protein
MDTTGNYARYGGIKRMTRITVTENGRVIAHPELFDLPLDCGPLPVAFNFLEMVFPEARSLTRTNEGWSVELGKAGL